VLFRGGQHCALIITNNNNTMAKFEVTLRLTVSQSVSMSCYRASLWDLRPNITSCRNVTVWNLRSCFSGAPSLTRGWVCNLQCNHSMVRVAVEVSKLLYDWQSVSMSWHRAPLWDLRPDITSCRNVTVWNLRSCFSGAPSLTRGRICSLQCNHSMIRVAQNS
jgi:hypothetical protein